MKTAEEAYADIKERFETRVKDTIEDGSMLDLLITVMSKEVEDIYTEIDRNRFPHIWTSLEGQQLTDTGIMVNLPRANGELDATYRYRLMNWTLSNETANQTAISDALLNPTYASNITFQPYVKGCGTAVCYVIPREYTTETITNALLEAKNIVEAVASPGLFCEFITPKMLGVQLQIYMTTENGDVDTIKENITTNIREYINNLAPYSYLQVGQINRIGITEPNVDYFSVLSTIVDGVTNTSTSILQGLDSKLLFDEIIWTGSD